MAKFKVVRMYRDHPEYDFTVKSHMTLEAAQKWCSNPETSSSTCTEAEAVERTKNHGPWFDCFVEE